MGFLNKHKVVERNATLLLVLSLVTVAVGGIVEIVPLFYLENTIEEVEGVLAKVRLKGLRGATGTQFSFMALLGDGAKVDALERGVCKRLGWPEGGTWNVCGQTYPRGFDASVLNALALAA